MLKARSLVMTVRVSHLLSGLSVAAILAFAPLAAFAQNAPMMSGGMKGEEMMWGGMKGEEMMKDCDMMGGDMAHAPL
jgi:Spy/CpxP family protein refolding chaperone